MKKLICGTIPVRSLPYQLLITEILLIDQLHERGEGKVSVIMMPKCTDAEYAEEVLRRAGIPI